MKKILLLLFLILSPVAVQAVTSISSSQSLGSLSSGLVAHWTMDGRKTNWVTQQVLDASGNGNVGQMQGRMATSTAPTEGKIGQALKFDGINDYLTIPDADGLDVTSTQNVTVAAWIKTNTNATIIASRFDSTGTAPYYRIIVGGDATAQKAGFGVRGSTSGEITTSGSTTVTDDRWHHVVGIRDVEQDKIFIYVDGVQENSRTDTTVGDFAVTNPLLIGAHGLAAGSSQWFNGSIDDVRIYNRALSPAEITKLYKQGGGTKTNVTQSLGGLSSGLVGHWTMDGKRTDWTRQIVNDSTANGNNGQMQGRMATSTAPTEGKIGQALKFDGSTAYMAFPAGTGKFLITDSFSGSAWIKTSHASGAILGNYSPNVSTGWLFEVRSDGTVSFDLLNAAGSNGIVVRTNTTVTDNQWHHVTFTYNGNESTTGILLYVDGIAAALTNVAVVSPGSLASDSFQVGNPAGGSEFFNGSLDDVRIYSRALSAAEITKLYKQGGGTKTNVTRSLGTTGTGLVGHWTFDGKRVNWASGIVADSSSSANNGVMTSLSTSTAPVEGKLGQALKFDGINDAVIIPNFSPGSSVLTVALWYKVSAFANDDDIIMELTSNYNNNDGTFIIDPNNSNGLFTAVIQDSLASIKYRGENIPRPSVGVWHHYAVVLDNSTATGDVKIYLDGVEQETTLFVNDKDKSGNFKTDTLYLMSRAGSSLFEDASIDDVRIYNRELTAAEVQALYKLR